MARGVLYTTTLSANGRKVAALVEHLGLDVEIRETNVYRGAGQTQAYLAINPQGRIPTWVEGDFLLSESNAILQYLAEASGHAGLAGRTPAERAATAQWLFWESAHWQPSLAPLLAPAVGHRLLPDRVPPPAGPVDWQSEDCARALAILERQLRGRTYLVREELTIADFSVAGMTTYFAVTAFPCARYPNVSQWLDRLSRVPAWTHTLADLWKPAGNG